MPLKIINDHPLARDDEGNYKVHIATVMLRGNVLITLAGTHINQKQAYIDLLNKERQSRGVRNLNKAESIIEWDNSVDLIIENGLVLIRPNPDHMERAFAADELLQDHVSKHQIKFLYVSNAIVKQAIKERGELWRIAPLPKSHQEKIAMIVSAKTAIANGAIYHYNKLTGTRYLTCNEFLKLQQLDPNSLANHLQEIANHSNRFNLGGYPEIAFFATNPSFGAANFKDRNFINAAPETLKMWFTELLRKFTNAVPSNLRKDNPHDMEWQNRMFSALIAHPDETRAENIMQDLSPEFYLQIRWLPGAMIQDGELIWDRVFDSGNDVHGGQESPNLCDWRARNLIFNFNRDYTDVEHINIGRIESSMSDRELPSQTPAENTWRGVYIVDMKRRESDGARVRIIRMQKWGVAHRLNKGTDLLKAVEETEEYTEYILDRRLACRQLGMNLPSWLITRTMSEIYHGSAKQYDGRTIQSHYFEREYVNGIATQKIPGQNFSSEDYALAFSHLLGEAAATNIIVGRGDDLKLEAERQANIDDMRKGILFDDGDEIVITNKDGLPQTIVVADHTGAFHYYDHSLDEYAYAYALPIISRRDLVAQPEQFAEVYLNAFMTRFLHIQNEYRSRQWAFDNLFKHRPPPNLEGNLTHRWASVLMRLDQTNVQSLADAIRKHIPF